MLLAILTGRSIDLGQHRSLDLFPAFLIFKLGLIDEVLAPASTNKRPVPEWQCHTAKQSRAHQPQLTCMLTEGLSVDPAVFLFGWLVWGRSSPSRSSTRVSSSWKANGTGAMPV